MPQSIPFIEKYKKYLPYLPLIALGIGALWLFFAVLFEPLLPFLLAVGAAALLQRPLALLDARTGHRRYGKRIISALLVILSFGALFAVGALFISHLFSEGRALAASFADDLSYFASMLDRTLRDIGAFFEELPVFRGAERGAERAEGGPLSAFIASFDALLVGLLQSALTAVTARLPAFFARIMAAMPRIFLFFGVWFMATLYLTPAWHDIGMWITKHFPKRSAAFLRGVRSSLFSTLLLYGRAYAILIALTFTELIIGLSLLGVPYVFGLSFLIALIDILPVLGVGTVLLPWALLSLLWGNTRMGFGLLVLYAVISVVRQLTEPRIIGTQVGLHPLIALFSLYVGARLFGAAGLFLLPMAAAVLARYLSGRKKEQDENAKENAAHTRQGRVQKRQTAP